MKKFYVIMLAAAAAAAFVSCNKEEDVINEEVNGEGIALTISTGEATKTAYDGTNIGWLYNDVIGVANSSDKKEFTQTGASYEGMKSTTQFSGTVPSVGTYYAYYPYSESMLSVSGVTVKLPSEQVQFYVNSSFDSFSPDADILVSQPIDVTSTSTTVSTKFKRLGAFLKITFNTSGLSSSLKAALEAQSVYGLTVTSDTDLAGSVAIDLANGELAGLSNGEKTIKLSYQASSIVPSSVSYVGIYPQTIPAGTKLTITADTPKYSISRSITLTSALTIGSGKMLPVTVKLEDADVHGKMKLEKVVGIYGKAGVAGWPAYVPSGSLADVLDDNGQLRNATFDKDYIYVAQSESWDANGGNQPYIYKFKTSDGTLAGHVTPATDPAYMGGPYCGVHPVSCVRFMDNSKPSVNGGHPVLVAVNLGDGGTHRIYAWENGINAQPRLVANFSNSRRLGDKVSVEGDYWNGKLWFRSNDDDGMVCYVNFVEGYTSGHNDSHLWNWVEARGKMPVDDANNISEYYTFGAGNYGLIATNSNVGLHLMNGTAEVKKYAKYARSFGWHAFTFNGMDYLAFLDASDGLNKPRITVLEGKTDSVAHLQETIENGKIAARVSIASENPDDFDVTTTYAHQNLGDCQVRVLDDGVYILGMIRGGVALFKVTLP